MQTTLTDPFLPALREALAQQKRAEWAAAEAGYREILALSPDHPMALHLLGVVLSQTGRAADGADCLRRSVALNPRDAMAHHNLAGVLLDLKDFKAAAEAAGHAVALNPGYVAAYCLKGLAWQELKRFDYSLLAYDSVLDLIPENREALIGRIRSLMGLQRFADARDVAQQMVNKQPDDGAVLRLLGTTLDKLGQCEAAVSVIERALKLAPGDFSGLGALMSMRMRCCLWSDYEVGGKQIEKLLLQGQWVAQPFALLALSSSPEVQLRCAQLQIQATAPPRTPLPLVVHAQAGTKVRIAYLSADLHTHATAYLVTELFELHDRHRFEVIAVSFGPDDSSPLRTRIEAAVDRFLRVNDLSDQEIAELLVREQVDIAVDLKGFTQDARPGIFQFKPSPTVVNFLGFPGTMGAACFDYIVGDAVVTPLEHAPFYSEQIVQLPHSYQVNDRQRAIAPSTPPRHEHGLPADGFVFACFNNNYKITPQVFDMWMRLLGHVPGSVLWLLADNADAVANLRRAAAARGIAEDRLVFAPRAPLPEHLARHQWADLFLDTLPCNAHTTASDALWAGLPVLTCLGTTFAGRVAASLLTAVGLPELITESLADYEATALQLANNPDALLKIRHKLQLQRGTSPLFDTPLFTAHLEQAYLQMVERHRSGQPPTPIVIASMA